MLYSIKNRTNRQIIIYTSDARKPEETFKVSPNGVVQINLTEQQAHYIAKQQGVNLLIR
jgi:hypothetical protein